MSNGHSKAELIEISACVVLVSKQPNNHSLNINKCCVGKIFSSSYTGNNPRGILWVLLFISDSGGHVQGKKTIQIINRKMPLN